MTTSFHIHVAAQVLFQIFSCFVKNAIVVSRIVAFAKYTTGGLESIAVMVKLLASRQLFLVSVQAQQRKEPGVKTKRRIQAAVAISTKFYKSIKTIPMGILFAIDSNTEETIVSESQKGSNKINFIERVKRSDNEVLFNAVVTLTSITNAANFDIKIFNVMDKVCQLIYSKYKATV